MYATRRRVRASAGAGDILEHSCRILDTDAVDGWGGVMDDDYGDYQYEKRKDEQLDRMHDLLAENHRLRRLVLDMAKSFKVDEFIAKRLLEEALQEGEG